MDVEGRRWTMVLEVEPDLGWRVVARELVDLCVAAGQFVLAACGTLALARHGVGAPARHWVIRSQQQLGGDPAVAGSQLPLEHEEREHAAVGTPHIAVAPVAVVAEVQRRCGTAPVADVWLPDDNWCPMSAAAAVVELRVEGARSKTKTSLSTLEGRYLLVLGLSAGQGLARRLAGNIGTAAAAPVTAEMWYQQGHARLVAAAGTPGFVPN